jgi:hypothetical protein
MFFNEPLPFVKEFISELNESLKKYNPNSGLSAIQKKWLSFCLMGILLTNTVCWAKIQRVGLGQHKLAALSWMFRKSKIPWSLLLIMSVRVVLKKFYITEGVMVIDDSDKKRSKSTKRIFKTHKIKDKTTCGYINGQVIIMLLLVTPIITIPVGFSFYEPDPALSAWHKQDKKLRKQGIAKKDRPAEPARNPLYPMKRQIALNLLRQFKYHHPDLTVRVILADALYGTDDFMSEASTIFNGAQVISQLRCNQTIRFWNRNVSLKEYFTKYPGVSQNITIRGGGQQVPVIVGGARLQVTSHKKKLFVIALKYDGEEEYRYLVAQDLSWRLLDIVQAYSLRWLVEVFFEDWKQNEGWGQLTKQLDEDGSSRSLILSLLLDHCLLFHHEQLARLENKMSACTVGSLRDRTRVDCLLDFIRGLLSIENPHEKLDSLTKILQDLFKLAPSKKHMNGRNLGRLESSPSLKYKAKSACAA